MKILLLSLTIGIYSCNAQVPKSNKQSVSVKTQSKPDFNVALKFINNYVKYLLSRNKSNPLSTTWVSSNTLLTPIFKTKYKELLASADPEFGLEADPILSAQDMPDKGFILGKIDSSQGYVSVKGIGNGWGSFEVVLRVVQLNGKSLVDGSGMVNIPDNKQANR